MKLDTRFHTIWADAKLKAKPHKLTVKTISEKYKMANVSNTAINVSHSAPNTHHALFASVAAA